MNYIDSGANPALSRRIAMVRGPIVRPLPDADVRELARGGRDITDLSPVFPLRVPAGWYAAYWYGDAPERTPSRMLAGLRVLRDGVATLWHSAQGRTGKSQHGIAGGHPAGAR